MEKGFFDNLGFLGYCVCILFFYLFIYTGYNIIFDLKCLYINNLLCKAYFNTEHLMRKILMLETEMRHMHKRS